jgi:hypothetical protein
MEKSIFVWKIPDSGPKFQDMPFENYPGRFRCRKVVVLPHAVPGPEFSGTTYFCSAELKDNIFFDAKG